MAQVILVIHMILALAIIGLVLLQRSEGGGLGVGTGGGMGGLATPQGTATAMTRATAWCVGGFFATSLILGVLSGQGGGSGSILDKAAEPVPAAASTMTETATDDDSATTPSTGNEMPPVDVPAEVAPTETAPATPSAPVAE